MDFFLIFPPNGNDDKNVTKAWESESRRTWPGTRPTTAALRKFTANLAVSCYRTRRDATPRRPYEEETEEAAGKGQGYCGQQLSFAFMIL